MSDLQKRVYLLDANVLFEFSLWLPMVLQIGFWKKLEESLKNGDWVLIDVVVEEIRYDNDGLKKWCKDQEKNGLVSTISEENRNRAIEINNSYKIIDETSQNSATDTYILAYAEEHKLTIFTRESYRKSTQHRYKIPDICDALNIKHERLPRVFMNAIGFKA